MNQPTARHRPLRRARSQVFQVHADGPPNPATTLSQGRTWLAAHLSYVAFGTVLQLLPPFTTDLHTRFHVSTSDAGLGMTMFLLPVLLLALPGGTWVDRHGWRGGARLGFVILTVGTVAAGAAPNFPTLLAARALGGSGAAFVIISALKLLGDMVPAARLGGALGVFVAGLPIGTVLAFDVIAPLAGKHNWSVASLVGAGVVAFCALLFTWATAGVSQELVPRQAAVAAVRPRLSGNPELRRLLALTAVGYATIIAFTTWAPTRLASAAHLGVQTGVVIASILLAVDIPFAPAWGRLSDRLGRRKPFLVLAFVVYATGAVALLGVVHADGPRTFLVAGVVAVMGIGCAMFLPASLAVLPDLVPASQLGGGYGLLVSAQMLGMAAGPPTLGTIFTHAGTTVGIGVIAGLALLGVAIATRLRCR